MLKKLISVAAAVCVSLCQLAPAMAAGTKSSFSDMSADSYGWAIEDVESMTRLGIIKGYSDGTFKPGNNIKKIEMLLLLSRAAGYSDKNYAPFAEYASAMYSDDLDDYEVSYKPEVAFLLYRGILSVDELDSLLTDSDKVIKRYETAVLLTKLMGAEEEVRKNIAASLDYADYSAIPASARTYVEYVTKQGIMNGVGGNSFDPMGNITRAQAAVILSRVIKKLDYSTLAGAVSDTDEDNYTVDIDIDGDIKRIDLNSADLTLDGKAGRLSSVKAGSQAIVLFSGSSAVSVDILSIPADAETYTGTLVDADVEDDEITFYMEDENGDELTFRIVTAHKPKITLNGRTCKFDDLSPGQTAVVTVSDDEVVSLAAKKVSEGRKTSVTGTITDIDPDDMEITVRIDNSKTETYPVSSDVDVERFGDAADFEDLQPGSYADIDLRSGSVTFIGVTYEAKVEFFEYSGYITSVDLTKGIVGMNTSDGEEELHLAMSGKTVTTTIVDGSTGAKVNASQLKKNQDIKAVGTAYDGDSAVTVIIIMP